MCSLPGSGITSACIGELVFKLSDSPAKIMSDGFVLLEFQSNGVEVNNLRF